MPEPSPTHPDLADLEAARRGEASSAVEAHVRACEECRRIVAQLATFADELGSVAPAVPEAVEARILWIARKYAAEARLARRRRPWMVLTRRRVAAIAAGVLLAVGALRLWTPLRMERTPSALVADVDGNGVVDIRDAFAIARAVRRATAPPPRFDLNGDHVVDERDVDLAAHAAVALAGRS
jgi:Dockerin type I domain